jgi:hypothetical protein
MTVREKVAQAGGYLIENCGDVCWDVWELLPDGRIRYTVVDANDFILYETVWAR